VQTRTLRPGTERDEESTAGGGSSHE